MLTGSQCPLPSSSQRARLAPTAPSAPPAFVRGSDQHACVPVMLSVADACSAQTCGTPSVHCWLVQRSPGGLLLRMPGIEHQRRQRRKLHVQRRLLAHWLWIHPHLHRFVVGRCSGPLGPGRLTVQAMRFRLCSLLARDLQCQRHVVRAVPYWEQCPRQRIHHVHVQRRLLDERHRQLVGLHRYVF